MDSSNKVNITVNGQQMQSAAAHLAALIAELGLTENKLAVECNGVIIAPDSFQSQPVTDGDVIELIRFVGGG